MNEEFAALYRAENSSFIVFSFLIYLFYAK